MTISPIINLAYEIASLNVSNWSLDIAYNRAIAQRTYQDVYLVAQRAYQGCTPDCHEEDLECPACLELYRNCECGVLRVCPDCGDFLDYGCMCNEAREEFEAEMCEDIDDDHICFECGVSYGMDSPNCTDHHEF